MIASLTPQAALVRLVQGWLLVEALSFTRGSPMRESSDGELIERARQKEPEAIQTIYQRHAAAVHRRLTHLLGPDPEREDLMQEVFVDLFRQLERYRGGASLRTPRPQPLRHPGPDPYGL